MADTLGELCYYCASLVVLVLLYVMLSTPLFWNNFGSQAVELFRAAEVFETCCDLFKQEGRLSKVF